MLLVVKVGRRREVFKMTFPQLMPDTFSRGKKWKKNANERGWVGELGGGVVIEDLRAGAWTLIKVTQQEQLEHLSLSLLHIYAHTRLYYPQRSFHVIHLLGPHH